MNDDMAYRSSAPGTHPPYDAPSYASTRLRHPKQPLVHVPHGPTELGGPRFSPALCPPLTDLSVVDGRQALGERIIVRGRVLDEDARPVPHTMIEIWQANAAGRYQHPDDQHDAPLDPNFRGEGRVFADEEGWYEFTTIKPGAYPWRNHPNAWRPNHIHFSLFGPAFATRLVTQMYFPGDPLHELDPIIQTVPDQDVRACLVSRFDLDVTQPGWALGYRFDIVLRGRLATPFEGREEGR